MSTIFKHKLNEEEMNLLNNGKCIYINDGRSGIEIKGKKNNS